MKMSKKYKVCIVTFLSLLICIGGLLSIYLKGLPALFNNEKFIGYIQQSVLKSTGLTLNIEKPVLHTSFSSNITFSVKELEISNDFGDSLLELNDFNLNISFAKVFKQTLTINELGAKDIFADVKKIIDAIPTQENKKTSKTVWKIDLLNSLLYIQNILLQYDDENLALKLLGKDIKITETRNPKLVKFNFEVELDKNNELFVFKVADNDSVFIQDQKLYAKNCDFFINKSKVTINYVGAQDNTFELNLNSDKFLIKDIVDLIETNLIIPNGKEILALFDDIDGSFDFKINMNHKEMNGFINLHKFFFKVPMVNNIPVLLNSGRVDISKEQIELKNFKGYYGKSKENKIDLAGNITDYLKTFNTNVEGFVIGTKEFTIDYLSAMVGYPIELVGQTTAKVKFSMLNNKIDTSIIFRLIEGYDVLVDGLSLTPTDYQRAFRIDLSMYDNILELVNLNYYIANEFQAGVIAKPILRIYGKFDLLKNMAVNNLGFEIPKPLPSEFLNVLLGQRIFRRGTIAGNMEFVDNGKPHLTGGLSMDKVLIPSQRLSIKEAKITTDNNLVKLNVNGRYKRSKYQVNGGILNEIKLPIIVKDINMSIDNIDIEKLLASFAAQPAQSTDNVKETLASQKNDADVDIEAENVAAPSFYTNVIVIENCLLEIVKGVYKQINFANVKANMTLDKDGVLQVNSNRFDIAEGISSAKIFVDLKNQIYKIRLGIKDVDADAIATSLLNLPREITGKARGLILLEADKSLKLNGQIKFDIKNGIIAKVGLVEYALKFVSLFRNPLTMISPATIVDLVNIPEGDFEKIAGDIYLKDNIVERMMIKSSAEQLATFIAGKYNLESGDASLRIYTKFSGEKRGVAGILRNFSLNSLANRVSLGSRNDSNYYSAELEQIPAINADEKDCQVFLTKVDGDVVNNNFLSSLKRIK